MLRVADALRLTDRDRARLFQLARPDLAFMAEPSAAGTGPSLSSLRQFANRLVETRGHHEALRLAVELVHASFELDGVSFALGRHDADRTTIIVCTGNDFRAWEFTLELAFQSKIKARVVCQTSRDGVRCVNADIHQDGRRIAILGIAWRSNDDMNSKSLKFIETIATLLEVHLGRKNSALVGGEATRG
ncbi:MAG: hypothetical protein IAI50_13435 [Candidatus Eremiobacteraeota bacterium]|nr:hypothetical protein [Candidatus Eremiobacteraeota bacterium]